MDQDNAGTPNPIAPEGASNTNEIVTETMTETVAPASPVSTPPTATQPKKPKGLIITIVILAILALAGIAFGIYGMFFKPAPTCEANCAESQTSSTSTSNDSSQDDPSAIATSNDATEEAVRNIIQKLYDATETDSSSKYNKTYDDYLFMKVDGANPMLPAEKTYGIFAHYSDFNNIDQEAQQNLFINTLSQLGFVKNEGINSSPLINGINDYINHDNGVVCGFSAMKVTCAHESWISDEAIEIANKLANAYHEKTESYPYILNTSLINIEDSEIAPYQKLLIPSDNAMALFYRSQPSEEWNYFTSTQGFIPCSDFNTSEIKNAFSGTQCVDDAGQPTTIKP